MSDSTDGCPLDRPVVRAITYNRVSTGKQQLRALSVPDQIAQNRKYCEDQGYTILEEVVEAKSATSIDARPELQRVLAMGLTKPPAFDVLVVHSTSRAFRHSVESEWYRLKLKKNGVRIESISQQFSDDPIGDVARQVMAIFDDMTSKETGKHVKRSMLAAARQGHFMSALAPYGYQVEITGIAGDRQIRKLALHPDHAEVVRLIFRLAIEGDGKSGRLGIKKIVTYLRDHGYRNRNQKPFYTSAVEKILKDERYTGTYWFNKTEACTRKLRPRDEWVAIPIPVIIPAEDFQQVQLELRDNAPRQRAPRIAASQVLLTGLVRCGVCGGAMMMANGTGANGVVHRYYKCAKRINLGLCDSSKRTTIREAELDRIVVETVAERLVTPDRVREIVERVRLRREAAHDSATQTLERLRRELKSAEKAAERLLDAVSKGVVSDDEMFRSKYRSLCDQRTSVIRLIESDEKLLAEQIQPLDGLKAEAVVARLKGMLETAPKQQQKRLVRAVVGEVVVCPDEIVIAGAEDSLAEAANAALKPGFPLRDAAHDFGREWLPGQDSNLRPTG
jgi:DNA invertase Pin-like site-specific DNA recombinase